MRRPTTVELMLTATVVLWALNLSVSRYLLTHGLKPVTYGLLRYLIASVVFVAMALALERSLRVARADLPRTALAAAALFVNQIGFVFAVKLTSASILALILATTPVLTAVLGMWAGTEQLSRRFWEGAALSVLGVGFVAFGGNGVFRGSAAGFAWCALTVGTWALYSFLITPLMRTYSPTRISAVVVPMSMLGMLVVAPPLTAGQDWTWGWWPWVLLFYAALGPLVITNVLWFHSLHRVGPSRATLAANMQPFLAAVFALVLLGERIGVAEIVGGVLIAFGILAGRSRTAPVPVE